jgi:hypothetical protein
MNDAYEIILRAVGPEEKLGSKIADPTEINRRFLDYGGDFSECLIEWRMSDHHGILPNDDERRELQAGLRHTFHGRYSINPRRVSIAVVATTPSRRPPASWKTYRYGLDHPQSEAKEMENGEES